MPVPAPFLPRFTHLFMRVHRSVEIAIGCCLFTLAAAMSAAGYVHRRMGYWTRPTAR